MAKGKRDQLASTQPATKQTGYDRAVSESFERVGVRGLPEGAGFIGRQPIPQSNSQLLRSLHAANTGGEVWTQKARVRCLIGQSADRGQAHIYGSRSQLLIFEMYSEAGHDRLIERQSRFRAVPADKVVDGTAIATLRFWRAQADEHCCFGVLQIGEPELGLLPI